MALTYQQEINRMVKYCKANLPQALDDEIGAYTDIETEDKRIWRLYDERCDKTYRVTLNLKTKEVTHQILAGDVYKNR